MSTLSSSITLANLLISDFDGKFDALYESDNSFCIFLKFLYFWSKKSKKRRLGQSRYHAVLSARNNKRYLSCSYMARDKCVCTSNREFTCINCFSDMSLDENN